MIKKQTVKVYTKSSAIINQFVPTGANEMSSSEPMDETHDHSDATPHRSDTRPGEKITKKNGSDKSRRIAGSKRAEISFPVGRIKRYMKEYDPGRRYSMKSAVYMATVLEYLMAEVFDIAVPHIKPTKKRIIKPKHIRHGIETDPEFKKLLGDVILPEGGVYPHINKFLFETRPTRKVTNEQNEHHEEIDNI